MGVFTSLRSKLSGQTQEAFGDGQRFPLNKQIITSVQRHMSTLRDSDLSAYTFERRRSDYAGAKSDLVIYDAASTPVLHGRELSSGPITVWPY